MILKIAVDIEAELIPLLPKYLENRKRDLIRLKEALKKKDIDTIRRIGHTIKGHAASYGFPQLSEICGRLEKAAEEIMFEALEPLIGEFESYINNIKLELVE